MYGFKLIVHQGHLNQRIKTRFLIDKPLPCGQFLPNHLFTTGRSVDDFTQGIGQGSTHPIPNPSCISLDCLHQLNAKVGRQEWPSFHPLQSQPECLLVTKNLLGFWIFEGTVRDQCLVQVIMSGQDIFNGRTRLGFL